MMGDLEQAAAWNAELHLKNHQEAAELQAAVMSANGDPRLFADRVSLGDAGTRDLAHQVHAESLVRGLASLDAGYRNTRQASHGQRYGRDGDNVPDVVHHLADEATYCHVWTGRQNPGWGEPGSVNRLHMRAA